MLTNGKGDAGRLLIRCAFVVTGTGRVITDGVIEVAADRIADVRPARAGDPPASTPADQPAVALPGLVNAHTHLELSDLGGLFPPGLSFIGWLQALMAHRADQPATESSVQTAMRIGTTMSLRAGVTTVGDITRHPHWTRPILADTPLRVVSYGEVIAIGQRRNLLDERLAAACAGEPSDQLRLGISPHAPYTIEPAGLQRCAEAARARSLPLTMHVCETHLEEAFTLRHTGALVDYLRGLDVWDEQVPLPGVRPVELLAQAGLLGPRLLLVHGNYLSRDDIAQLAGTQTNVVFCPRAHQAFGHRAHPYRQLIEAGVNVCVGTDSLACAPSLSVLDELRFLRRLDRELDPQLLIAMGTANAARALGWLDQVGTLEPGKRADITLVPLAPGREDDWVSIFRHDAWPLAVYVAGEALPGR